jgi:hypothetical protein
VHRALAAQQGAAAAAPANWMTSDAATGYAGSPIVPPSKPCTCQHP